MKFVLNIKTGRISEIEGSPTEGTGIEKIEGNIFAEFKFEKDGSMSLALLHPRSSVTRGYDVTVFYFPDGRVEFRDSKKKPIEFAGGNDVWDCWAEDKICLIISIISFENHLGGKFNFPGHVKRKIFEALTFRPTIIQ